MPYIITEKGTRRRDTGVRFRYASANIDRAALTTSAMLTHRIDALGNDRPAVSRTGLGAAREWAKDLHTDGGSWLFTDSQLTVRRVGRPQMVRELHAIGQPADHLRTPDLVRTWNDHFAITSEDTSDRQVR